MTTYSNELSQASLVSFVPDPLHRGGLNIVRFDGHYTYVARSEILKPVGPSVPINWTRSKTGGAREQLNS